MTDTPTPPPRNDAAMADILASIRRIVAEEDARVAATAPAPPGPQGDILELTPEMRADRAKPEPDAEPAPAAASPSDSAAPFGSAAPAAAAATASATPDVAPPSRDDEVSLDLSNLPVDEAQVAEIVRAVLRDELRGDFGARLSERIRAVVREELARAIEELASDS